MSDNNPEKSVSPPHEPDKLDAGDPLETLHVAPPNFRERIAAAQRARTNETRPTIDGPTGTGRLGSKDRLRADGANDGEDTKPMQNLVIPKVENKAENTDLAKAKDAGSVSTSFPKQ